MLPILQRRFRALENSKAAMLQQVRALAPERLNDHPRASKWSVAQVLDHLVKVERTILRAVQQRLREDARANVGVSDRVGSLIVRNVMRSPLRARMSAEVLPAVEPDSEATAAEALAAWEAVRSEWREFLDHVHGPELKDGVFAHPKGGWFTLPETVLFLRLHHDHHRAQLARIGKALQENA